MVSDQQLKLKAMRTLKVKDQGSIETKIFSVLKEIGVELSAYHGGSLNGKDIKKVMNNACHIFDRFSTIFKGGRGQTVRCWMPILTLCACSFERCLFYGMGCFR